MIPRPDSDPSDALTANSGSEFLDPSRHLVTHCWQGGPLLAGLINLLTMKDERMSGCR